MGPMRASGLMALYSSASLPYIAFTAGETTVVRLPPKKDLTALVVMLGCLSFVVEFTTNSKGWV